MAQPGWGPSEEMLAGLGGQRAPSELPGHDKNISGLPSPPQAHLHAPQTRTTSQALQLFQTLGAGGEALLDPGSCVDTWTVSGAEPHGVGSRVEADKQAAVAGLCAPWWRERGRSSACVPTSIGRASRRRQRLGIPSRKRSERGSSGHKALEILPGGPRPTGFGWNTGVEAPRGQRALPPSNQGRTHPAQRPSTPVLSSLFPFLPSVMIWIPGRRPAAWSAGREGDWCRPASAQLS